MDEEEEALQFKALRFWCKQICAWLSPDFSD
jgi:hypothetical protein